MEALKKILEHKDQFDLESSKKLGRLMFERIFNPKDMGINYRTIVHWEEKGILSPEEMKKEPNKWRNFSFIEMIWIDLVNELRKLGYTLPQVLLLKKHLFDPFPIEEFLARFQLNTQENMTPVEKKLLKNNKDALEKAERFKALPPDKVSFSEKINELATPILIFIKTRVDTTFHIYSDGTFDSFNGESSEASQMDWQRSHISITLSTVMQKYLQRDQNFRNSFSLAALSKDELTVLHYLRQGDLKSLTIRFDETNTIKFLETKEEKNVDIESRFLEHILKDGYQEISFKTRGGKITTFERTTKHKLN